MEEKNPLKEVMTTDELCEVAQSGALHLVMSMLNGWYVVGQACVLVAHACGRQFPFARYRCIETGKKNAVWRFEKEL